MTEKYEQTSKRWGSYRFGNHYIGMTPSIAHNKPARVSYIMGWLAGATKNIEKYDRLRERYDLPDRPFNAGYRNRVGEMGQDSEEEGGKRYKSYSPLCDTEKGDSYDHLTSSMGERLSGCQWEDGRIVSINDIPAVDDI